MMLQMYKANKVRKSVESPVVAILQQIASKPKNEGPIYTVVRPNDATCPKSAPARVSLSAFPCSSAAPRPPNPSSGEDPAAISTIN